MSPDEQVGMIMVAVALVALAIGCWKQVKDRG